MTEKRYNMKRKICTVLIGMIMACTLMACGDTTEPQVGKNDKPYSVEMNSITGKDVEEMPREEVDTEDKEMDGDINGSKNEKTTISSDDISKAVSFEKIHKLVGTADMLGALRHF